MFYQEQINKVVDLSMSDIIRVSNGLLPHEYKSYPWKLVNHGVDLLSSEVQLCAYISAYGEMHWAKCRAAFQNFPFEEGLKTNFEVVDWGCGQGVATISFIEMLRERDKQHLLRKVTLIEPSDVALNRAYINVDKATNHQISILQCQKYLPCQGADNEIKGIEYEFPIVIHLFSNILDIYTVNLEKLASLVGREGRKHYIMCMGPTNSGAYRIDQFCSIFNVSDFISNIENPKYGYTAGRHKLFSCKTKCLVFENGMLSTAKMHEFVAPTLIVGTPVYDDYDSRILQINNVVDEHVIKLSDMLGSILKESDYLYIKPNINGDVPDIVVVRPNRGIFLINVCLCKGKDDLEKAKEEVSILYTYQRNLIQLHMKDMMGRALIKNSIWGTVKMMLYFPFLSTESLKQITEGNKYINVQGCELFDEGNKKVILSYFNCRYNREFDNLTLNSFVNIVSPRWHSFRQGKHIVLTNAQKTLVKSESKVKRKINGVAGSGKTQVLATRAVNAHLRSGKKVLVLTYNLTLVNYIKYRIGEVRADFSWDNIIVSNYHQFFKSVANNFGEKVHLGSFENQSFFKTIEQQLPKYSAIFVDEVQDYKTEWLRILCNYFLEEDGEFVVFGDAKQNIYNRPIDTKGQVQLDFISGSWNNSLNRSMRFANTQLANLAMSFQRTFLPNLQTDNIDTGEQSLDFDSCIKYWNIDALTDANTIMSNCRWILQEFNIDIKDVVVLSKYCETLRELDYCYKQQTRQKVLLTNETKEQFESLKNEYGIIDDSKITDFQFYRDLKHLRRSKRIHFSMDTEFLKLSTIHSYKGWEAKAVILVLTQSQDNNLSEESLIDVKEEALIYTAITRAKEKLFILNLGNTKYHSFFAKYSY